MYRSDITLQYNHFCLKTESGKRKRKILFYLEQVTMLIEHDSFERERETDKEAKRHSDIQRDRHKFLQEF